MLAAPWATGATDEPHAMPSLSGVWAASRKPGRFTVTLPQHVLEAIAEGSTRQGRSMSNYAAFLLETALFPAEKQDR